MDELKRTKLVLADVTLNEIAHRMVGEVVDKRDVSDEGAVASACAIAIHILAEAAIFRDSALTEKVSHLEMEIASLKARVGTLKGDEFDEER